MNATRKWLYMVVLLGLSGLSGLILTACNDQSGSTAQSEPTTSAQVSIRDQLLESVTDGEISLARNFYFVFDGSGSMAGKMDEAKAAIKTFIANVPEENVNLGLFVFDERVTREVVPLAPDNRKQFLAAVNQAEAGGGTPLGTSIKTGIEALIGQYRKQLGYGEYRLIVVTDGDSDWNNPVSVGVEPANRYGFPIYTIGFGIGEEHELRQHSVSYRSANNKEELARALEEAVSELDVFEPANFEEKEEPAD